MKKIIATTLAATVLMLSLGGCTEAGKRSWKSMESNWTGGLNRTVTVYDYNGNPIKSWTGHFDVSENTNEVWFDLDGKRVIITGGIIINEEN